VNVVPISIGADDVIAVVVLVRKNGYWLALVTREKFIPEAPGSAIQPPMIVVPPKAVGG
jgi:hypothetical protein